MNITISNTSNAAIYEQLEAEGLIYSQPGKGFYVSHSKTDILKEKR